MHLQAEREAHLLTQPLISLPRHELKLIFLCTRSLGSNHEDPTNPTELKIDCDNEGWISYIAGLPWVIYKRTLKNRVSR